MSDSIARASYTHCETKDPLEIARESDLLLVGKHASGEFSFGVNVAFSLNYIMGTGFLTIPWAFYKCGVLLGTAALGFLIIPSIIAVLFILEAMARAEMLFSRTSHFGSKSAYEATEAPPTASDEQHRTNDDLVVGEKKFEINELCQLFLGEKGAQWYTFILAIYMYGTLWAYSSVFGNAMTSALPLGDYSYHLYLVIFAVIVVPASCMELSEQIVVQVVLALCRVVMVVFMLASVLIAYASEGEDGSSRHFGEVHHADVKEDLFHLNGLHIILPIAVYANVFHHSIPPLAEPAKDKRQLGYIFSVTLFVCFVAYSLVGFVLSFYFGKDIQSAANLNWENYGDAFTTPLAVVLSNVVQFFVIIFPALDVGSAFPLNAITLGNNLYTVFHPTVIEKRDRGTLQFYRLVAAIPPIIGAGCVADLGKITNYTGISGFVIMFIFPAWLASASEKYMRERNLPFKTHYSGWFTASYWWIFIFVFGCFLVIFVVSSLIMLGSPV